MSPWPEDADEDRRVLDWLDSGIVPLTGSPNESPRIPPGNAATLARHLGEFINGNVLGARFLSERAAFTGFNRRGAISLGGSCRLLPTLDGWAAVSCARPDDPVLLGAMISAKIDGDPWPAVRAWSAEHPGKELAERATLLGLAVAPVERRTASVPMPTNQRSVKDLLVVDFSALWSGPLCSHLLGAAGARIVKVETPTRPDGARRGNKEFYTLLHAGHESVVLDPTTVPGRSALAQLVERADIVIEASRPRALVGFGLDAEAAAASGTIWISITAAGRKSPRVGFGDDIAASSGLIAHDDSRAPVFVGDAIADPLSGLMAAALAMSETPTGAGYLWDLSMADLVASTLADGTDTPLPPSRASAVAIPEKRQHDGTARASGSDTHAVLRSLGIAIP